MALLLEDQAASGTSEVESLTGPVTVYAYGVFDGASVYLEMCPVDGDPEPIAELRPGVTRFTGPDQCVVDPIGPYDLRARLDQAGPLTSVTVEIIEA